MTPRMYAAAGIVLALLLAGFGIGWAAQKRAHAPDHAKLAKAYELAHTGLLNAGAALRQVSAMAREDAARAREQQAAGAEQASQARADALTMRYKADKLEAQLRAERSTCSEAEVKVCGIPLR